jgi:UDP-N-acetylmuramoylalanine--D-glutamate ligase
VSGTRPEEPSSDAAWLPRRALVVGLARSGRAAAAALARRGVDVVAADRAPDADPGRLGDAGVELRLGTEEEALLAGVELVVKSPGVPAESPLVTAARERTIPVWSEVELGYRLLPAGARLIGVTGTNGKTTTT